MFRVLMDIAEACQWNTGIAVYSSGVFADFILFFNIFRWQVYDQMNKEKIWWRWHGGLVGN